MMVLEYGSEVHLSVGLRDFLSLSSADIFAVQETAKGGGENSAQLFQSLNTEGGATGLEPKVTGLFMVRSVKCGKDHVYVFKCTLAQLQKNTFYQRFFFFHRPDQKVDPVCQ